MLKLFNGKSLSIWKVLGGDEASNSEGEKERKTCDGHITNPSLQRLLALSDSQERVEEMVEK